VYRQLSGDGTLVARIVSLQGESYPLAGVMIRETLGATSTYEFMYFQKSNGFDWTIAQAQGEVGESVSIWNHHCAVLVEVVRSGGSFTGYISSDGVNWVQQGSSVTINMAQNVYVGLGYATQHYKLATATFDNVSFGSITAPAPLITSVSATTAAVGNQVIISGANFGATQGSSVVLLNGRR